MLIAALDDIHISHGVPCSDDNNGEPTVDEKQWRFVKDDKDFSDLFLKPPPAERSSLEPREPPVFKEVNIDIYEASNRSFVDEPSEFTIQLVQQHNATINPQNMDQPVENLNQAYISVPLPLDPSAKLDFAPKLPINAAAQLDKNGVTPSVTVYIGIAIGVAVLAFVAVGTVATVIAKRRTQLKQKPITEETEFQYFSYNNDGFRELNGATLPVDRFIKK